MLDSFNIICDCFRGKQTDTSQCTDLLDSFDVVLDM